MKKEIQIKNYTTQEYTQKQSKYEDAPKIPFRALLLAPSNSGKTVLIQNMVIDIYNKCFERIYIFSPSTHVDDSYKSIKDYQTNIMKVEEKEDKLYFDHYNVEDLENIISQQHEVIMHMKEKKMKNLFSILIIVDDFADDPSFSRHSKSLWGLFSRGRHNQISVICSTQKYKAMASIIRLNVSCMVIFRLKNNSDLESFLEELSGTLNGDKKALLEIYNIATKEPYSFLYVNLNAKNINDMFYINFNQKIKITDS